MPHWISLIICYTFIIIAFTLMMFLRRKSCTTTAPEDSPSKTEPSPTGPTERIFRHTLSNGKTLVKPWWQEGTEFQSQYRNYLESLSELHRSVSDFFSEQSTDGVGTTMTRSHVPPITVDNFAVIKCNGRIVESGPYQECIDNAAHYNTIYQTDEYVVERWVQQ